MQTTLVGSQTGSRNESPEVRREAAPFTHASNTGITLVDRGCSQNGKNLLAAATGANATKNNRVLVAAIINSKIYQDYEKAFSEATGLSMSLRPVESWQTRLHNEHHENDFCRMMPAKSSACLQVQERLSQTATREEQTVTCSAGMSDTAVPVRLGDRLIGFLQTGQVFRGKPAESQFERTTQLTNEWDVESNRNNLHNAYFETQVMSSKRQESVMKLLSIFAQHLSLLSNQVIVQQENAEPPVITRAKEFIHEHQAEEISLGLVAKAVNTSTFYFCKMFKKHTGINFTDYLSRIRIEKSKNLLLNPNLRVSEIAFEVGFQSLTHFNRVFKKLLGQSPTAYRAQLLDR